MVTNSRYLRVQVAQQQLPQRWPTQPSHALLLSNGGPEVVVPITHCGKSSGGWSGWLLNTPYYVAGYVARKFCFCHPAGM